MLDNPRPLPSLLVACLYPGNEQQKEKTKIRGCDHVLIAPTIIIMECLISLGFRATAQFVYYSVVVRVDGTYVIHSSDKITCPKALNEPNCLKYIRQAVCDLINEYKADYGGIKLIENSSLKKDNFRLNIEGVIQEAFASSSLKHFFFGTIPKITGAYRFNDKKKVKALINGEAEFDYVNLVDLKAESRESAIVAIAAILEKGHKN